MPFLPKLVNVRVSSGVLRGNYEVNPVVFYHLHSVPVLTRGSMKSRNGRDAWIVLGRWITQCEGLITL